ncbi:HTH-like domain-containing protein [Anoxybacillus pushchinoensis]|uniref:HTH-like domain-containing protein n=1 Tax=Anoxybacillus pushchinoensis TaxID=150248 RepID=A0A1I0SY80_9BACL|nr:HTH-like domain-containing protein [Anoxybacillus pushchinoensis]
MKKQIKNIHIESRETYGSPKITKILQKQGVKVSQKTVARIMKDGDIRSKTKKKYKATTNSKHHSPMYPNLFFTRPLQQGKRSNIGFLNILSVFIMPSKFIPLMSTYLRWHMRRCISKAKNNPSLNEKKPRYSGFLILLIRRRVYQPSSLSRGHQTKCGSRVLKFFSILRVYFLT